MATRSTLTQPVLFQQEIKKSRFLAVAGPVADEAAAKAFIAARSDRAANHNCWAWRIGQTYRFSDDGEPSGTAGKPILAAIDGQGLDRVAVVVTRWFGGVLLGSGGLIRAYGGTAALCLRAAEKVALLETVSGVVACRFSDLPLIQARLGALASVEVKAQSFTDSGAVLSVAVARADAAAVDRRLQDLTHGQCRIDWDD